MPHRSVPTDSALVNTDAITQVLIARTRESLCEAGADAAETRVATTLSARVDGTDLFVITPDTAELHALGPAATTVVGLDGSIVERAWDGRSMPSPRTPAHARTHRTDAAVAVASHGERLIPASTPAEALRALAASLDVDPTSSTGPRSESGNPPRVTDTRPSSAHPTKE